MIVVIIGLIHLGILILLIRKILKESKKEQLKKEVLDIHDQSKAKLETIEVVEDVMDMRETIVEREEELKKRKIGNKPISKRHQITKEEAINFVKESFGVKMEEEE